ncbi:MAG TPA: class I SAM-dependent methyltransferase, partial [Ferruginibacter sp.]|nr:class I SAM-dependent methyltransferase [Ferruginibacter sp.]
MDLFDQAAIFRFHQNLTNEFGKGTTGALGWKLREGQQARFEMLSRIGDLNHHSVLDAGCGHGDLREFLGTKYHGLRYYGVEQIPSILQEAIDRYDHLPETYFYEGDFSAAELPAVDYVLACGALSYRNSDPLFALKTIQKLFNTARIGLGFNMLARIEPAGLLEAYHPVYITE